MAHIGTLRDFKFKGDVDDIRGADLYGRGNERLGKVSDVVFDHAGGTIQYLVVDTGGWLKSNKFLVPADRINAREDHGGDFTCDLSKDQIVGFPEFRDSVLRSNDDWEAYEKRYRSSISTEGDVLHREGGENLITPEPGEMPAATGVAGINVTPTRLVNKFSSAEPTSDKTRLRPAGTAARAEDAKMPGRAIESEPAAWAEQGGTVRNRRATDHLSDEDEITEEFMAGKIDEEPISSDDSAFGDVERVEVPGPDPTDPPSYRAGDYLNSTIGIGDATNRRLADFEDALRRNRVDITATCRACGVERDEIEYRRQDEDAA